MLRWGRFAATYVLVGVLASVLAYVLHGSVATLARSWLDLSAPGSHAYSLLLGVAFGGAVVLATRACVGRFGWARDLHGELRPIASGLSVPGIVALALTSAFGEELLFRGLLQPFVGEVVQAVLFGLAHQIRGPSRFVWVAWASIVGLALGLMYSLTGSLAGPIAAHALINGLNLLYLKAHDPARRPRALGGLLGERPREPVKNSRALG